MDKITEVENTLKDYFRDDINDFYVSYIIFPSGLIISADTHADMLDYLVEKGVVDMDMDRYYFGTDIFVTQYNCVRCAKCNEEENYVEIPSKPLTSAQYQSLTEWLDDNSYNFDDIHVTVDRDDLDWDDISKFYNYNEYTVDEIINKIKRYYAFGKLQESRKSAVMGDKVRKNSRYTPINEDYEMSNEYDSEGNQLSKAQVDFFKNSKVRDSKGNLLVVYHGTQENFDTFNYDPSRQTGRNYGKAYYFTDNRNKALGYSVDIYKDKRVQDYDKKHKELLKKFLDDKSEENKQAFLDFDPKQKNLIKILNDEDYTKNIERVGYLMECYLNLVNPLIKDAKGKYDYEVYPDYFKEAEEGNYDGIIVHNVKDVPRGKHIPMTVYIAFKENQMKNIFNYEPSISNNINEVYPNKGESKKDFIARFMKVTKDEYPDIKQRYAVANSYWDRRDLTEAKEDIQRLYDYIKDNDYVNTFLELKKNNRIKSPENDIYYWLKKDPYEFKIFIDKVNSKKSNNQIKKDAKEKGVDLIYIDSNWQVYKINTHEAAQLYGKGTEWCITETDDYWWNDYKEQGVNFYYFIPNSHYGKYALAIYPNGKYCIFNEIDEVEAYIEDAPKVKGLPDVSKIDPTLMKSLNEYGLTEDLIDSVSPCYIRSYTDELENYLVTLKNGMYRIFSGDHFSYYLEIDEYLVNVLLEEGEFEPKDLIYYKDWFEPKYLDELEGLDESLLESKADQEKFKKWCDDNVKDLYSKESHLDIENYLGTTDVYELFNKMKPRMKSPENDIYYWMNWKGTGTGFFNMLRYLGLLKDKINKENKSKEGARLVYSDNDWKVYAIDNYEASKKYGANTKWCISGSKRWNNGESGEEYFNNYYNENGIRFYFFINKDTKYALCYNPEDKDYIEIFNAEDISIPYIPNAPKIPEIKVDYTEDKVTNQDRLANYIASPQCSEDVFMNTIEGYFEEYMIDANIFNDVNVFLNYIKDNDFYKQDYVEWLRCNRGKITPEEYKRRTGEEYSEYWGGDMSRINYFDTDTIDPKTYEGLQYIILMNNEGDDVYDICECKDRLSVFTYISRSVGIEISELLQNLAVCLQDLIVKGLVPNWKQVLSDAKCSEDYINYVRNKLKESLQESKQDRLNLEKKVGKELSDRFFELKNRLQSPQNDVYYWLNKKPSELENALNNIGKSRKEKDAEAREGTDLIFEDDKWLVLKINTHEASKKYGKGTKWCISGEGDWKKRTTKYHNSKEVWDDYVNNYNADIWFFINKKDNHKYCVVKCGITLDGQTATGIEIYDDTNKMIVEVPNAPRTNVPSYSAVTEQLFMILSRYVDVNNILSIVSYDPDDAMTHQDIRVDLDGEGSRYFRFDRFGRVTEITKKDLDAVEENFRGLNESLLNEATRQDLLNKSRKADNYSKKNQKKGKNRYERRLHSKIARSVRQYNRIDFDAFFKKDILTVGIEVNGETNNYIVTMRFEGALREIANEVKANKGLLEFKTIARALSRTFNMDNVKISCTCPDHRYRMAYYQNKNGYGIDQELRPSMITNPKDTKGAGCKHVLLVLSNLDWMLKVASVVNNYIKYSQKNLQNNYANYIFPKIYGMPYRRAVQLSWFEDGLLPSDQEFLTKVASTHLKDKDANGKWKKDNSFKFQPKKRGIQPNPNQLTIYDMEKELDKNEAENSAKLGSGITKGIKLPTEEES